MTDTPKFDLNFDFLPDWARKSSSHAPREYKRYEGESGDSGGRDQRQRGRGRDQGRGRFGGQDRSRGGRPGGEGGPSGPRGAQGGGRPGGGYRRGDRPGRREAPAYTPVEPAPLDISFLPYDETLGPVFQQIRSSLRAFRLFDLANQFLQAPERFRIRLRVQDATEPGKERPFLYQSRVDQVIAMEEGIIKEHLATKCLEHFFEVTQEQGDPPKGVFQGVSRCRLGGEVLCPPNYHEFQNALRNLQRTKYPNMSLDQLRDAVEMVSDETLLQKWMEEASLKTIYREKDAETLRVFDRLESAQEYVRNELASRYIRQAVHATIDGTKMNDIPDPAVKESVRQGLRLQRRYPLLLSVHLRQSGARRGMFFFKRGKITYITGSRPTPLPVDRIIVSEGVHEVIDFVQKNPQCKVKRLLEAFVPGIHVPEDVDAFREDARNDREAADADAVVAEAAAADAIVADAQVAEAPVGDVPIGDQDQTPGVGTEPTVASETVTEAEAVEAAEADQAAESTADVEAPAAACDADAPAAETSSAPEAEEKPTQKASTRGSISPEELVRAQVVMRDLDWLVRAGHLIEYWDGSLDLPRGQAQESAGGGEGRASHGKKGKGKGKAKDAASAKVVETEDAAGSDQAAVAPEQAGTVEEPPAAETATSEATVSEAAPIAPEVAAAEGTAVEPEASVAAEHQVGTEESATAEAEQADAPREEPAPEAGVQPESGADEEEGEEKPIDSAS